ncbi:MAG: winged helix-turn-helix transcriptional regulator [Butyrivibrio sp.]|nr:winged helix-turn-helix transcriptional regulator [Butyrivibrio sp.]
MLQTEQMLILQNMPSEEEMNDLAELFKAFGDITRMRILYALSAAENGELAVGELADALGMTQSAVSHQLKILKQFRLVGNRREGKSICYFLADEHVRTIVDMGREHIEED